MLDIASTKAILIVMNIYITNSILLIKTKKVRGQRTQEKLKSSQENLTRFFFLLSKIRYETWET